MDRAAGAGPPAKTAPGWADAVAGLSLAGLLLPEAVAYAGIAGLPPGAGIAGLFAGLLCYALLGSSRFAVVSATSSSAAVLAAATASIAGINVQLRLALAGGLVLVTGVLFVIAAAVRLGSMTDFIARPVLRGFAFGLSLVIVLRQLISILGLHPGQSDLVHGLALLWSSPAALNRASLTTGLVALALLFLLQRFRRIPAGLVVIALGILASRYLGLEAAGVSVVGPIRLDLQGMALPALERGDWLRLGELGFAMVLILYSESYGSIRSFALRHGDAVRPNRDLLALGLSNIAAGLFHGVPVGAGYSATSANEGAGAQSKRSGLVAAAVLLLLVLTVLPAVALTPEPVLAAIVIHAVSHALNPAAFRVYFQWRRDRLVVVAAVLAVLWLGVLDGLLAAIGISLILLLRRLSAAGLAELGRLGDGHDFLDMNAYAQARPVDGLLILRPEGPLFFANAERVLALARHRITNGGPGLRGVVLSLEESFDLDSASVEALRDFQAWVAAQGLGLALARLKDPVRTLLEAVLPAPPAGPLCTGLSVDDAVATLSKAAQIR